MQGINLFLFGFIITIFIAWANAENCEYYDGNGICVEPCPDEMIRHATECEDETMSQRTCQEPIARSLGNVCDQTRCDCPTPKVFDEAANKCVNIEECPDQSKISDSTKKE